MSGDQMCDLTQDQTGNWMEEMERTGRKEKKEEQGFVLVGKPLVQFAKRLAKVTGTKSCKNLPYYLKNGGFDDEDVSGLSSAFVEDRGERASTTAIV